MNDDRLQTMLTGMLRTRKFEEKAAALFEQGLVHGTTHLYIGQEAVAAGVCAALGPNDQITSTHRGHGHCICRGIDLSAMAAEFLGRAAGCGGGRGGSMHFADPAHGNLGETGVVGGGFAIAAGAALTARRKHPDRIVVCFCGDGAMNEGSFHEAANLASVWRLPLLFVCENNRYGMSMPVTDAMNIDDIALRAASYGFPGKTVDGNDAVQVYDAACDAREYVAANGPMLLVCDTYRIMGHSKSDGNAYRTQREIDTWKQRDPIEGLKAVLRQNGLDEAALTALERRAADDVEAAYAYAAQCPYPSADTVRDNVYA